MLEGVKNFMFWNAPPDLYDKSKQYDSLSDFEKLAHDVCDGEIVERINGLGVSAIIATISAAGGAILVLDTSYCYLTGAALFGEIAGAFIVGNIFLVAAAIFAIIAHDFFVMNANTRHYLQNMKDEGSVANEASFKRFGAQHFEGTWVFKHIYRMCPCASRMGSS